MQPAWLTFSAGVIFKEAATLMQQTYMAAIPQQRGQEGQSVMLMQAIELALEQAGNASAETTIFLDDSTRNIVAGHQKGLATVLVSK